MPQRIPRASTRLASLGMTTLALAFPAITAQTGYAAGR
jgi:hypothetical protein